MLPLLEQRGSKNISENERKSSSETDLQTAAVCDGKSKLLDVGCGTGASALIALSHGYDVVVTDVSEAMVERTKERAAVAIRQAAERGGDTSDRSNFQSQLDSLSESVVAEGQNLPSRWSESFDLAVANFSVIFFPQPVQGLKEIFRCLLSGTGIVALTAWGDASETPAFRIFPEVVSAVLPELAASGKPKRITGSAEVLTKLLEEAGFVDVRIVGPVFKTLVVRTPSEFYDRFALTSPPTAAMIAKMDAITQSNFRKHIMDAAKVRGGKEDGSIALDSGAYIAYGRKPASVQPREGGTRKTSFSMTPHN